jgi:aspartate aminotransferase
MPMGKNEELDSLRSEVRDVTSEIMRNIQKRMELAKQIGEIKGRLGIDVKDERVEQEIRAMVLSLAGEIGMSDEFALRLLNILLAESESVQGQNREQQPQMQTHLGIFMKAKQLEAAGKKIIHMEIGEPDYAPPAAAVPLYGHERSPKIARRHYQERRRARRSGDCDPGRPIRSFQRNCFAIEGRTGAGSDRAGMASLQRVRRFHWGKDKSSENDT